MDIYKFYNNSILYKIRAITSCDMTKLFTIACMTNDIFVIKKLLSTDKHFNIDPISINIIFRMKFVELIKIIAVNKKIKFKVNPCFDTWIFNEDHIELLKILILNDKLSQICDIHTPKLLKTYAFKYIELIDILVKHFKYDINSTLLYACRYCENYDYIKALILSYRNNNIININNLMCEAATYGQLKIMKLIYSVYSNINHVMILNQSGSSKLYKNIEIIKYLHTKKLVTQQNFIQNECVDTACKCGNIEIVKYLIDDVGIKPITSNIKNGFLNKYIDIVKYLMRYNSIDLSFDNNALLKYAIENHDMELFKFLMLDFKVHVKYNNNVIFDLAFYAGNMKVIKFLMRNIKNAKIFITNSLDILDKIEF